MIRLPEVMRPLAAVASEAYSRVRATRRAQAATRPAVTAPPERRTADPNAWLGVYVDAYA